MSVQRLAAHPLVVAVALGLLGPDALDTLPSASERDGRMEERTGAHSFDLGELAEGATVDPRDIDPEDFARVEREWYEARDLNNTY